MDRRPDPVGPIVLETFTLTVLAAWRWRIEIALLAILAVTYMLAGPFVAAALLILVLGVPQSRRALLNLLRAQRVKRQWTQAVVDSGAADPPPKRSRRKHSLTGPRAIRVRQVKTGDLLSVKIGRGNSADELEARSEQLAACLSGRWTPVREVRITRDRAHADRATALLVRRDPFEDAAPTPWALISVPQTSVWDTMPFGFYDDGDEAEIDGMDGHILIGGVTGSGKALALDTLVPTPEGWTTMGDVQRGDLVFDEDGTPCFVTDAWDVQYGRPCFEVTFSDGSTIVADEDHQWLTETFHARLSAARAATRAADPKAGVKYARDQSALRTRPGIVTTGEIRDTLRIHECERANHAIKVAGALQLPHAFRLLVNPYVLGAWLGDGTSRGGGITSADPPIIDLIRSCGETVSRVPHTDGQTCGFYRVAGLTTKLRKLGILQNKHIPTEYLRASEGERRALLAGLLDTDGHCTPLGAVEFAVTCERLARDTLHLVASLGYKPTMTTRRVNGSSEASSIAYKVAFTPAERVFALPRKAERQVTSTRSTAGFRYIVDVQPVPSVPVRCIAVDSASHLFLVGETCIPTHNSVAMHTLIAYAALDPTCRVILLDNKRAEFAPWEPVADAFIGPSMRDAVRTLQSVQSVMTQRFADQTTGRVRKVGPGDETYCVFIDELAYYLLPDANGDKDQTVLFWGLLLDLLQRGRSAGIRIRAATQRPSAEILNTNLRAQFGTRIAFRVMEAETTQMILGSRAAAAHDIPDKGYAGVGYMGGESTRPRRFRAPFLSEQDVDNIVARAERIRTDRDLAALLPHTPSTPKAKAAELRTASVKDALLSVLPTVGEGMTRGELREATKRPDQETFPALKALLTDGVVVREGGGVKGDAFRYKRCAAVVAQNARTTPAPPGTGADSA